MSSKKDAEIRSGVRDQLASLKKTTDSPPPLHLAEFAIGEELPPIVERKKSGPRFTIA
jgi:hypothetical protein